VGHSNGQGRLPEEFINSIYNPGTRICMIHQDNTTAPSISNPLILSPLVYQLLGPPVSKTNKVNTVPNTSNSMPVIDLLIQPK